jgi:hypothetical protein
MPIQATIGKRDLTFGCCRFIRESGKAVAEEMEGEMTKVPEVDCDAFEVTANEDDDAKEVAGKFVADSSSCSC